tara:strand:+ start:1190 stop:3817 length:2628 start_codon:yes stop_codon:yes gene_type:complete
MSSIEATMINADVLSSSSDSLRVAMGSFWETESPNPLSTYYNFNEIQTNNLTNSFYLSAFYSQIDNAETGSFIFPSISMPVRLAADPTKIKDDNEWKAIMIGGTWGNRNYQGIFTNGTFDNLTFNYDLPYPKMDANTLDGRAGNVITINYNYRQYLQQYQLASFDRNVTEHTLYNHYVSADLSRWQNDVEAIEQIESDQLYAPELINYITREGKYTEIYQLNEFDGSVLPYAAPTHVLDSFGKIRTDNTYLSKNYLTSAFVQTDLSTETKNWVGTRMRNMIFDTDAVNNLFNSTSQPLYECAPYDININWQSDISSTAFLEQINDNNFSSRFIKTLYSAFSGDIEQLFPADEVFTNASTFLTSSRNTIKEMDTVENQTLRSIEYDKLLAYCRNTYDTTGQNNNCMFLGEKNMARAAAQAEDSKFRFFNSKITTRTINNVVNYVNANLFNTEDLSDVYIEDTNYSETLAYRIEKIGGLPSTDARTQNVLQNFWLMNSADIDTFDFHDTQVKYDRDYTYNVYAYVLVVGTKYSTSDLVLSRDLGCEDGDLVGVEMYNPTSGDRTAEIYESNLNTDNLFKSRLSDAEYGETFQIFSQFPYVADYMMKYQPVMKIIEVPLYSKTLRVLDNPGNKLQTIPYQIDDDSQRIGFKFDYEFFTENNTIMSAVTTADQNYINNYLHANDLTPESILENETVANPRTVEVFRLERMPSLITDFEDSLLTTIDLSMQNDNINTNRETYYEDAVVTNQKYYYLFRALNQQGTISHLSEIYEAQLVNDGGYNYAVFNVINEKELQQHSNIDNTFNSFKKIFQLQPNIGQITLQTNNADFEQEASSQMANVSVGNSDDLIWDKTFKIRLSSKKTGRKIDLNVTYKLNSE